MGLRGWGLGIGASGFGVEGLGFRVRLVCFVFDLDFCKYFGSVSCFLEAALRVI